MSRAAKLLLACSVLSLGCSLASAQHEAACGSLDNPYGPYDYRVSQQKLRIVEQYHFTPEVEMLQAGKSGLVGGDLDYTLRASPNHHRALMSMVKLGQRERTGKPRGSRYSVACWFDRAERFQPDDAMVKVIHGLYLIQTGKPADAISKLEQARELDSNNANVHYNLGLAYFDLKKFDQALDSAHVAYSQGFPLPGLREKLRRAGKWRDPFPATEAAAPEAERPEAGADSAKPVPQNAPAAD